MGSLLVVNSPFIHFLSHPIWTLVGDHHLSGSIWRNRRSANRGRQKATRRLLGSATHLRNPLGRFLTLWKVLKVSSLGRKIRLPGECGDWNLTEESIDELVGGYTESRHSGRI